MMVRQTGFRSYHPFTQLCYFLAAALPPLVAMNPIMVALSMLCAVLLYRYYRLDAELSRLVRVGLPLLILVTLANPLVNHRGQYILLRLFGKVITLEALLYGLVSGMLLFAVLLWFGLFSQLVTEDRQRALFGGSSVGLAVSMTLRLVPMLLRRQQEIGETLSLISPSPSLSRRGIRAAGQKAAALGKTYTVLLSCALEDSLDTARSMNARGYGAAKRTAGQSHRFRLRDGVCVGLLLAAGGSMAYLYWRYGLAFRFYPVMTPLRASLGAMGHYIIYTVLLAVPLLSDGWEAIRWNS